MSWARAKTARAVHFDRAEAAEADAALLEVLCALTMVTMDRTPVNCPHRMMVILPLVARNWSQVR
jgi:hypothetical protein